MRVDCDAGCTNGIFYFTGEERLQDSQPCGNCHGKGWTEELLNYSEDKCPTCGISITIRGDSGFVAKHNTLSCAGLKMLKEKAYGNN